MVVSSPRTFNCIAPASFTTSSKLMIDGDVGRSNRRSTAFTRIEDMARKDLKLEPIAPAQLVAWKTVVTDGDGSRQAQSFRKDGIAALIEKTTAPAGAAIAQ